MQADISGEDGVGISWAIVQATLGFGVHQLHLKRAGEARNHFVLELEQVHNVFIESIRPEMRAGFRVNELGVDAHPVGVALHRAFEDVATPSSMPIALASRLLPLKVKAVLRAMTKLLWRRDKVEPRALDSQLLRRVKPGLDRRGDALGHVVREVKNIRHHAVEFARQRSDRGNDRHVLSQFGKWIDLHIDGRGFSARAPIVRK